MKVTVKNKAGNQKCWRALCGFRFCFLSFFFLVWLFFLFEEKGGKNKKQEGNNNDHNLTCLLKAHIHLDVEGVALCQILLVSSVFKADASPASAHKTRFRRVVTRALHAQIRMVICIAFFNRFGNPKQNNIISIAHSIFPYFSFSRRVFLSFRNLCF